MFRIVIQDIHTLVKHLSGLTFHRAVGLGFHYCDVIMGVVASQITSLAIVYSIVYSDAYQRKHQSSASLAFVRGIHRGPVNSPHKWPVTRKMFPFDDVIMWGAHRIINIKVFLRAALAVGFFPFSDSKVHGANMGPIWGRQDPGGPHVDPMIFAIWVASPGRHKNIVNVYIPLTNLTTASWVRYT